MTGSVIMCTEFCLCKRGKGVFLFWVMLGWASCI